MIDLYLCAPTATALTADLAAVGLAGDGQLIDRSHRHFIFFVGQVVDRLAVMDHSGDQVSPATLLPGVYAGVRCRDDTLADSLRQAAFAATIIVDRPEHAPGCF